ncbi:P-loop containing nucleoside triphosphate hydrolase protein [Tirmania nivea]|nr:P-loop containing nucleoside triphosphate hydrolase protein [Tirmania nivea]
MIVIMGMRGGGKSSFVNQMVGGDVAKIGDGYTPCTFTCQAVPTRFGRSKVILIDTPGLDKSNLSETVVSAEISRVLAQMYQRGVSLRGFIYLHRITEKKTIGGAASVLKMFRSLCGDTMLLKNTILVTTGWQLPQVDESQGAVQERELRKFWSQMLHQGSTMGRYYGERDSGVGIVGRILGNEDVPFETEAELIARGKKLEKRAKIAMEVARLQQEMVE